MTKQETPETALALIQKDIVYISTGIDEVKDTLKEMNARFASKEEVEQKIKQIEKDAFNEIKYLKTEVSFLKRGFFGAIIFVLSQVGLKVFELINNK